MQKSRLDDSGRTNLERAIQIEPKNPFAYYLRSNVQAQKGDSSPAPAEDADQALFLGPRLAAAYHGRSEGLPAPHGDYRRARP